MSRNFNDHMIYVEGEKRMIGAVDLSLKLCFRIMLLDKIT